jgi:putative endonuclease
LAGRTGLNKRQIGSVYELKASDYLTKKGYQIIERNYRCRIGEIDIIAIERDCLCFIEVKYRKNEKTGDPLEAVDKRKQQKIIRTAQYYLLTHSKYQSIKCRFDAVGILGEEIRLVRDAFLC